jgi:fucose 4-O-acetylase-like acetyltransferase
MGYVNGFIRKLLENNLVVRNLIDMSNIKELPYEQLQSDTIKLVRFPLIVGVMLLHVSFELIIINGQTFVNPLDYPVYDYYKFFFDKVLAVRIPLYFFISGYLFFNRADSFTKSDYFKKLKRRKDTLMIPYVSWIVITIIVFGIQQTFFSQFSSGLNTPLKDWGLDDVYYAFWGGPLLRPLWYIRDLFSIMVLSPILYWLIKKIKLIPVVIFTILWIIYDLLPVPGISLCGLAFFGFGAYFSITKKNFVRIFAPYSWYIYGLFLLLAICLFVLKGTDLEPYFNRFMTPVGSICIILICSHLLYKKVCKPSDTLANASFFIYVYHQLPTTVLLKLVVTYVPMHSSFMLITMHLICTTIIVGGGLLGYLFIRRYSPLLLKLLSGGR